MNDKADAQPQRRVVLGIFNDEQAAQRALDTLVESDFPLDRVSILGQAGASGDDPLGIYYANAGERMKGWGSMGALWGGLFGLLSGAAGLFVLPGIGAVFAFGPIAEALVGGAAGAGVGGGAMVGGAALSGLTQAVHRMGVPEERLDQLHQRLQQGEYVVMLIVNREEADESAGLLEAAGAEPLWRFPYIGIADAVTERMS